MANLSGVRLHRRLGAMAGHAQCHHPIISGQHGTTVCDRELMVDEDALIHELFVAPETLGTERKAPPVILRIVSTVRNTGSGERFLPSLWVRMSVDVIF